MTYFITHNATGKILGHSDFNDTIYDDAIACESSDIQINTEVIEFGDGQTSISYSYTPSFINLADFKNGVVEFIKAEPILVGEVMTVNDLIFNNDDESINYLNKKLSVSTNDIVVYDKYFNSSSLSNQHIKTIISTIAEIQSQKLDAKAETIINIKSASSIESVATIAKFVQEKTLTLIVDVDDTYFDDVNQVNDEASSTIVMPLSGELDLSTISWMQAVQIKSINGQQGTIHCLDVNSINTADLTFSGTTISGSVLANGLPVNLTVVCLVKFGYGDSHGSSHAS